MKKSDIAKWRCRYRLEKRHGDIDAFGTPEEKAAFLENTTPYEVIEREGNCLLNTGIDEVWDLVVGDSANHFSNAKATIGVGDSATEAAPADTDLKGANKTYKGMVNGFPTSTAQKATFKASFGADDANHVWAEWVVKQADSAVCLNRRVDALGTKVTGTWTMQVEITLA